jgi:hypothetical protein
LWIESTNNNPLNAADAVCDASAAWLSQVMSLLSGQCFLHGDLRISLLLLGFVLQEALCLAIARKMGSQSRELCSQDVGQLQVTIDLLVSEDKSVHIVS